MMNDITDQPKRAPAASELVLKVKQLSEARAKAAEYLWQLLDDIDTLDDACKDDDLAFRNAVRKVQQKRNGIIASYDGYNLTWDLAACEALEAKQPCSDPWHRNPGDQVACDSCKSNKDPGEPDIPNDEEVVGC